MMETYVFLSKAYAPDLHSMNLHFQCAFSKRFGRARLETHTKNDFQNTSVSNEQIELHLKVNYQKLLIKNM